MLSGSGGAVRRILAVAGFTFREAWRRKMVIAALVMAGAFLALYGTGMHFAAADMASNGGADAAKEMMQRTAAAQMLSLGLFPTSFIVALTAIFASVGAISGDLDSGALYGVLARPVRRWELVVGKALGLSTMLAVFSTLVIGALVWLAKWQMGTPLRDVPAALGLFLLEPIILVALATLGSSRLPTLANGVLCAAAYGIGIIGGVIEQIGAVIQNTTMQNLGIVSSLLMPVDAMHRKAVSLLLPGGALIDQAAAAMGQGGSATPSSWMVVYAVGYVVIVLALAARVFARRDL
jgi:Cu-processing system permease protein